jgi:hypothetical protein
LKENNMENILEDEKKTVEEKVVETPKELDPATLSYIAPTPDPLLPRVAPGTDAQAL